MAAMLNEFLIFFAVGFGAQVVDGALGMAYGVVSSTVLLAFGVPPSHASASVHAAEVFTTAASASSHLAHRNVDWKMFWPLAVSGVIGGILGAYVLTAIEGDRIKPFIVVYLGIMGAVILWRAWKGKGNRRVSPKLVAPLGLVGGFADAAGGGGWGPTVTSSLVGSGAAPRQAVGTANTAEFLVTVAVSAAFLTALLTGNWKEADGISEHITAVAGLIMGGLLAAPFAGLITKKIPVRTFTWAVGALVVGLAVYQALRLFKVI
ncbi:MAG TPA: sulfite exporter TauE/SafE family protein [Caulobacteraceae bacterium]|nr:sulfite exporter TauE/SafE family protein [Caulobacteraceae bacterium]